MSIETQKALVDDLLTKLEVISPYVILAGGAPRDWYLGEVAQDLDIYIYSSAETIATFQKQLKYATGIEFKHNWELQANDRSLYTSMPQLRRVFEAEMNGEKVQIMQLNNPRDEFKVVDNMSTSVCKAWYKSGNIYLKDDFKLTIATNTMFLSEGYSWADPHPKKMLNRFKDKFYCGTKSQIISKLVRDVIDDI